MDAGVRTEVGGVDVLSGIGRNIREAHSVDACGYKEQATGEGRVG